MPRKAPRFHDKYAAATAAFGASLARTRMYCGVTQTELQDRSGIAQACISRLENGTGNPTLQTMCRLAGGLGYNLEFAMYPAAEDSEDSEDSEE